MFGSLSSNPLLLVVIIAGLAVASPFIWMLFAPDRQKRQEKQAAYDANAYMTRVRVDASRTRHLKLLSDDNLVVPGIIFEASLGSGGLIDAGNAYIDGIEAVMRDVRKAPTNPVIIYTGTDFKPNSVTDIFLVGAINTYRTRFIHVRHHAVTPEGRVIEVYDSAEDGNYDSFMLSEDIRRHQTQPSPTTW